MREFNNIRKEELAMPKQYKISKMNGKSTLITGGLGFIGSNLAHKLVSLGADVVLLDGMVEPYGWNLFNIQDINNDVQLIKIDVRDKDLLQKIITDFEFDYIFHLAAQVGREISMEDPYKDLEINCKGTLNILEACRKCEKSPKIIFSGTRGQIGEPEYIPVDGKHPTNPTDVYGINKLAAEKYLLVYHKAYGIPVVSLRLNNVYGPRCQTRYNYYGILNWFIRLALEGKTIPVYGDGQQTRDYIYIEDVVDAFCLASQNHKTIGKTYFVGSGKETIFLKMVEEVIAAVGKGDYAHIPFPQERERIDIRRFVIDYSELKNDTGWHPTISLKKGIKKTVEFYKANIEKYI